MGQSLSGRPLHGSREEEASFADSRLNALTLCLLESLGIRHAVVGVLLALKANSPYEEIVVCCWEFSEVLQVESPSHTPVQQGLHHLGLYQAHLEHERGIVHIVQLALETIVACPR